MLKKSRITKLILKEVTFFSGAFRSWTIEEHKIDPAAIPLPMMVDPFLPRAGPPLLSPFSFCRDLLMHLQ